MSDDNDTKRVPSGRVSRFTRLAALAGDVAGGMLAEGARQLASGNRPKAQDMLLTPRNIRKISNQLAQMRGAAMKLGQLISMDGGDLLPKELADILARLRSDAKAMPRKQLEQVLRKAWGDNWQDRVQDFEFKPTAAASIGQVHVAHTLDGRRIAVKIQYPGVRDSISSDVDNVSALIRATGLLPKHLDIKPLLAEAKAQLQDEADYEKEAAYLQKYRDHLGEQDLFIIPAVVPELTTQDVLVMSWVDGDPIESLAMEVPALRNLVVSRLLELLLRELFEFRLVQTDPNFGNFLYDRDEHKPVLLDFGACRPYTKKTAQAYKQLLKAVLAGDIERIDSAATKIGYFSAELPAKQRRKILDIFMLALEPVTLDEDYDFANSTLPEQLRVEGVEMLNQRKYWHTPPTDSIFLHRKIGGLFLLASRLQAKVNIHRILKDFV